MPPLVLHRSLLGALAALLLGPSGCESGGGGSSAAAEGAAAGGDAVTASATDSVVGTGGEEDVGATMGSSPDVEGAADPMPDGVSDAEGEPTEGQSCCAPSPDSTGGCNVPECAGSVCVIDDFCCTTLWDSLCTDCAYGLPGFGGADCSEAGADCPCEGCPPKKVSDCSGGCMPAAAIGNGLCDKALDCADYSLDGGDCGNPCEGDQVLDCDLACADAGLKGDGSCDAGFQCAKHELDGGDCPLLCEDAELAGCDGLDCMPAGWHQDGICDSNLNCEAHAFDGGDCCPVGQLEDCQGSCAEAALKGDGACDENLACEQHGFDGGDCPVVCVEPKILTCESKGCIARGWKGDGICDVELACAEHDWDSEDCCEPGFVKACDGSCADIALMGNGACDELLNCEGLKFDDLDCEPSCPEGEILDCDSGCTQAKWKGDGICDAAFDCEAFEADGGDCTDG